MGRDNRADLVDGRVGAEEVEVLFALDIPDIDPFSACEDDGDGVIVERTILLFLLDEQVGGRMRATFSIGMDARRQGPP